ncbi:MAG: hypothetical protein IPK32_16485 [Verrucomicrobiaceae bacterium]|nr:hypothetical protein [Verrucomicrobiaceae bacterium]
MQPPGPSRSALPPLLGYLAAVLIGGALLAPLLFDLGKWAQAWLSGSSLRDLGITQWLLDEIRRASFTRYFNRAVLVLALGLLWPLMRLIRLDRRVWPPVVPVGTGIKEALTGFALAAGLLFGLGLLFIQSGVYQLKADAAWLRLAPHLTAALGAGIIEELFFSRRTARHPASQHEHAAGFLLVYPSFSPLCTFCAHQRAGSSRMRLCAGIADSPC